MMAFRHYTKEELCHLRNSPLVHRPANLSAVEQWIEETAQSAQHGGNTTKRQPQNKLSEEPALMGNFTTGLRPSLGSRSSRTEIGDDVSLGPPRTMFPSSRTGGRMSVATDKGALGEGVTVEEHETSRSRFFSERQSGRKSMNEREAENSRESWTLIRERRQLGQEDGDGRDRYDRHGRRDRDQDGERRNGFGEKNDGRWGERRQNGERLGGWRDRERQRKEPEWMSSGQAEKNPEWMDDPTPASGDDDLRTVGMTKRAEDFQRWKDERKMKEFGIAGGSGAGKEEDLPSMPDETPSTTKDMAAAKQLATLKLDGLVDQSFGGWNDPKTGGQEGTIPVPKVAAATGKAKSSRFASMFKEVQPKEEPVPENGASAKAPGKDQNGNADDEAGFKRIMQMLGSTHTPQPLPQEVPSSPASKTHARQTSRYTGFFDQTPKSPEQLQSPPAGLPAFFKSTEEGGATVQNSSGQGGVHLPGDRQYGLRSDGQNRSNVQSNMASPAPPGSSTGSRDQRSQSGVVNNIFLEQPPSRGASTPDLNIQNLLAGQRSQRPQGPDKNSEFLLNLLQNKGSRPPSQQARSDSNFPLWLDQPPPVTEQSPNKPGGQPPLGQFEDQHFRNAPQEPLRHEQLAVAGNDHRQRLSQRAPPGLGDEQSMFPPQQQQAHRRNYTESAQQQPGHRHVNQPNLPHMQIPGPPGPYHGPPPEFLQSPGVHQHAPPPGFPHIPPRHPSLHNLPNPYQPLQPQPSGRDGMPSGPPGFPGNLGGMISPTSPPNVPPGFFGPGGPPGVPPGFASHMRSPTDTMIPGPRGGPRGFEGGGYERPLSGPRH